MLVVNREVPVWWANDMDAVLAPIARHAWYDEISEGRFGLPTEDEVAACWRYATDAYWDDARDRRLRRLDPYAWHSLDELLA